MQINANELIDTLLQLTEKSSEAARKFRTLSNDELNFKSDSTSWSILECIEHLNLYGDFYLPEIEKRILAQKGKSKSVVFKSGLLGNYFANMMLVKDGQMRKMKTFKDKDPANSALTITTIERFLKQQEMLKNLLNQARSVNLTKTKTAISISSWIKLRLGDTFRFFIYHIERHIFQAMHVLEQSEATLAKSSYARADK